MLICCYCVNPCGWFLRQVVKSTIDEDNDYNCEELQDGCKLIEWT